MYSLLGTLNNILRGLGISVLVIFVDVFFFGYIFPLYARPTLYFGTSSTLTFLLCFLVLDLLYYFFHLMKHSFGVLWMLHSVHHSGNRFNMSTYLRASWIERLTISFIPLFIIIFLGFNLQEITLAIYISFIYQFYCHSQYLQAPKFLQWLFITPHMHRIHHDQAERNQRSNFGAVFSIWDRIFGTYTPEITTFTPGIRGYEQENFIKMETEPVRNYFATLFSRHR